MGTLNMDQQYILHVLYILYEYFQHVAIMDTYG